ncbi:MAG: hypothetical protein L6R39_004996 [Caloplaca ligustica]|nr:MAG: hypothetical protein L6R39_004996 [Caloplaca ligustica]
MPQPPEPYGVSSYFGWFGIRGIDNDDDDIEDKRPGALGYRSVNILPKAEILYFGIGALERVSLL